MIPWEALVHPGILHVGVYGLSKDGKRLPTIWCEAGTILQGSADYLTKEPDPTPSIWEQQLNLKADNLKYDGVKLELRSGSTTLSEVQILGGGTGDGDVVILPGEKGDKGDPGEQGPEGPKGDQGDPGEDGFSPIVSVEPIDGGHRITIQDATSTKTFDVLDGQNGSGNGGSSDFITIQDTNVQSLSQLAEYGIVQDACCVHLINSNLGMKFANDIVYVIPAAHEVKVITMDNATITITVNTATGAFKNVSINRVDTQIELLETTVNNLVDNFIPGSGSGVINRCVWIYAAGDDISLFANGATNVAGSNEFVGSMPEVSENNIGLILVNSKLYWTKFNITAVARDAVTQEFTQDPIVIGPIAGGSIWESVLFLVNHNKAPKVNDYFNITPDRIYGAIPVNGEHYTLIVFAPEGLFDCTCEVVDYTPGKWATQVKVTTVSGVGTYSKDEIDAKLEAIELTPGPQGPKGDKGDPGEEGPQGDFGVTFIPSVSEDGVLSWTNNGDLPNPEPVNIKGPGVDLEFTDGLTKDGNNVKVTLPTKAVTSEEYEALSEEEKMGDVLHIITDDNDATGLQIYSTEETRIGTWINGKPLYRCVFEFTSPNQQPVGSFVCDISSTNFEVCTNIYGYVMTENGDCQPFGWNSTGISESTEKLTINHISIRASKVRNQLAMNVAGTTYVSRPCVAVMEYTKTTD